MAQSSESIPSFELYGEKTDFPDILHVESLRDRAAQHGWTIAPHRHSRLHQFVFLAEGEGRVTVDGTAWGMTPGVVVNLPPEVVHSFRLAEGALGDVLTLPVPVWHDMLVAEPEVSERLGRAFLRKSPEGFGDRLDRVRRELRDGGPFRRLRLQAALADVLLGVLAAGGPSPAEGNRRADPRLQAFRALIETTPTVGLGVAEAAERLGLSMRHLSRLCREATGVAPQALIHAAVLREACRLLAYTRLQVAEVGHRVGFDDPAYFSRFFHREMGLSPRGYRERIGG